jgi:hypothetical protein
MAKADEKGVDRFHYCVECCFLLDCTRSCLECSPVNDCLRSGVQVSDSGVISNDVTAHVDTSFRSRDYSVPRARKEKMLSSAQLLD